MKQLRWLVGGVFSIIGCGDVPDTTEEAPGTERAAITGGSLILATQHVVPLTSVIKLQWSDPFSTTQCSGIKVNASTYWTAAHCVVNVSVGATRMSVTNNPSGAFAGTASYTQIVTSVAIHPSFKNFYFTIALGREPEHYDVAVFTLNSVTPEIPSFSTTDNAWIEPNQNVSFTGYGCDNLHPSFSGRKLRATFSLGDLNALASVGKGTAYYAHNFVAIGDNPQGCDGDSGAPVWKTFGSTQKLVGFAVNGGQGYTGFARYSNVRLWLAAPAVNSFQIGFRGFIFNQYTGRCLAGVTGGGGQRESHCDGRSQPFDFQNWYLADSGVASTFYIKNGSTNQCLDIATTAVGASLVQRACVPTSQSFSTQRWSFAASNHSDYRRLVNVQTGLCAAPSNPGSTTSSIVTMAPCSTAEPTWRHQAWVMTR